MADDLVFRTTSGVKDKKPISFTVDDDSYTFISRKTAELILPVLMDDEDDVSSSLEWLRKGLPEDEYKRLEDRLYDPDDDFDVIHLSDIVVGLMEKISGRPTKSSRASRRARRRTGR